MLSSHVLPLPFAQAKRTAMCVALSHCDLCVLNSYDLKVVMKDFPNSARQLEVRGLGCAEVTGYGIGRAKKKRGQYLPPYNP